MRNDVDTGATSPQRALAFKIVLVLSPFLILLLVESCFAVRFTIEYPESTLAVQGRFRFVRSPYRGYANNPGYINVRDGVRYRYNNYGFREEGDLGDKGVNEFRVFFMGASAAYGTGAREIGQYRLISGQETYPSSETISAFLEQHLSKRLPDRAVNVINAAVSNYRIHNDFLTYLALIRSLSPDLVVTMDGYAERFSGSNTYGTPQEVASMSGGPLIVWLRSHSYTLYYTGLFWFSRQLSARQEVVLDEAAFASMDFDAIRRENARQTAESKPDREALDELMKVYEIFFHMTKLDGVPILFTIQPIPDLDQTKDFTLEEERLLKYLYHLGHHEAHVQVAHLADRLAARAEDDSSLHFLSLLSPFQDFPGLAYVDYCHLSPGANDHIAKRLADYILGMRDWTEGQVSTARINRPAPASSP